MKHTIVSYELSKYADKDLEDIFDYTLNHFGLNQAAEYVTAFEVLFNNLVSNPELGRERTEVRQGLRSIVKEKHVVFYRILKDKIRIVRVLHVSRDLTGFKM